MLAAARLYSVPVMVTTSAVSGVFPSPLLFTATEFNARVVVPETGPAARVVPNPTANVPALLAPPTIPDTEPAYVKPEVVEENPLLLRVSVYVALTGAVFVNESDTVLATPTCAAPILTVEVLAAAARL